MMRSLMVNVNMLVAAENDYFIKVKKLSRISLTAKFSYFERKNIRVAK